MSKMITPNDPGKLASVAPLDHQQKRDILRFVGEWISLRQADDEIRIEAWDYQVVVTVGSAVNGHRNQKTIAFTRKAWASQSPSQEEIHKSIDEAIANPAIGGDRWAVPIRL